MRTRELERRLRTLREPTPSPELRARLEEEIPDSVQRPEPRWSPLRSFALAKVGGTVAAVGFVGWILAVLLGGPASPVLAAVIEPVAEATAGVRAVHVVLHMLTGDGEDFSYVNLDGGLNLVEAWVRWPAMPGDTGQVRIDKNDRIYSFDGVETVFYHPVRGEAFRVNGRSVDLELLWPAAWLRHIRDLPAEGVEIVEQGESGGRAWVLFKENGALAGEFDPSFLGDFDRETEVVWDPETHLLQGLRRWVYHEGERVLFSEIVTIDYRDAIDDSIFTLTVPPDVRWGGVKEAPAEILDLGPREVARRLFEAAARGDRDELELFCPSPSMVDWLMENRPTEIQFIGEPFRAGGYPQVFVPYRVRFGDSDRVKKFNLALRIDDSAGRWVFDGGI